MESVIEALRWLLVRLCFAVIVILSLGAAFLLRFDFSIPVAYVPVLRTAALVALASKIPAFHVAGLHRGWWRFVGMADLLRVAAASTAGSLFFTAATYGLLGRQVPRTIYCLDWLICFVAVAGTRFCVRLYREAIIGDVSQAGRKGLLIYGAGMAGLTLLREIRSNPSLRYDVIGLLDDDPRKRREALLGTAVLGTGRDAARIVERQKKKSRRVEEIVIAMPTATRRQMQEALANCRSARVPCKIIPGIGELLEGKVLTAQIRDVAIRDVLGREPVRLEEDRIRSAIAGRSILITGAAGSIGSELCRQVARFEPQILVAFDQAETDLFRIDMELRRKFPSLMIMAEIGDIRDADRVNDVIHRYAVSSIFHAAAYKHVPMMEAHVLEAARNNVLGTWNLVQAAHRNRVANFLMISSDKAVNPTNVMGTTKRVAELIVKAMAGSETNFVSVRFGNVLGSNGSVVPLFQEQIAAGGPVTVTHPEVKRYFMTIREAVHLVLQASTMGKRSEIFVLDMGEPVRIVDLARNLIRLSGRVPDEDIEIRYTGLRPGEKLFEELIIEGEHIVPTYHEKIKIFQGPGVEAAQLESWLGALQTLLAERDEQGVVVHLKELVPEYQPSAFTAQPRPERADVAAFW
ncbi:MAG: polysaccharide biosynthesis protein [Acidobacteria bacterium]|nr:polysaccharide biosynthesis protein [Acidobacteriota bacterium]